jgi:hypothetical protein
MASMRHPHVVAFLGICSSPPALVTEYCARGSLADVLCAAKTSAALASRLDWGRRILMVRCWPRGVGWTAYVK